MLRLDRIKDRLSEARLHSRLEEYEHLWTDDLREHVLIRVRGENGAIGYLIEHAATRTPIVIEDQRVALLVVEHMREAGVRIVDESVLDRFIEEQPRLAGFLAWFIDADRQGLTDEEVARRFVSPHDPEGDCAMVEEGRRIIGRIPFPDAEVGRCANRYFEEPGACREWLGKMLQIVTGTITARQEEIDRSLRFWEGVHPLPNVWPERCAWCRRTGEQFFVVLFESDPETRQTQSEVVCGACAKAGRAYIHLRKQGVSRKQILRDFGIRE